MDIFTQAYIAAALWSSRDDNGEPLDYNYDMEDIAPDTLKQMMDDCKKFQEENKEFLQKQYYLVNRYNFLEIAGHDFWLTRNHHGAGYWDGDWEKEIGEKLTEASQKYKEIDLYVGDDGQIYHQ